MTEHIRRITDIDGLPPAVASYSLATVASPGEMVFTSGQVSFNEKGELVLDTIEDETHQVMENLQRTLGAAGCRLSDVVKTTICIIDRSYFKPVNNVYGAYFAEGQAPARECVVAAPPIDGPRVEMSMMAIRRSGLVVPVHIDT